MTEYDDPGGGHWVHPPVDPDEQVEAALAFEREVSQETRRQRVRTEARRRIAAEAAAASTLLADLLDIADLDELPHPEPLIEGVLARHCYAVLRGRDSTFKSFVALDWAMCLAAGVPWQRRDAEQCRVLYVAGEGAYGLQARVQAWQEHHGVTMLPGAFTVLPRAVDLFTGAEMSVLLDVVRGGRYGLVVLDTLRRMSGRADGNGSDMAAVIDNVDAIRRATDHGSVLVLSHTDKSDRDTRGFSGIEDDADIVWATRRDDDAQAVDLVNAKMKDGPDGARYLLRPQPVGESIVLVRAERPSGVTVGGPAETAIVSVLMDRAGVADPTTAQLEAAAAVPSSSFYRALKALKARGVVEGYKDGRSNRVRLRGEGRTE
ncbi:AAA family ATPase [Gephyromycinifex aptenodytis]|uniref:AAA family ATPase n=1 Tax=Gephyromycinifex aptenodytis TaxID=2716227 RepID=UPI0014481004|nr:AAA family ATPase [Gephyromycinifex aptenodytis]